MTFPSSAASISRGRQHVEIIGKNGCGGALQSKLQLQEQTRTKAYHLEFMVFSNRFLHHPGKFSGLIWPARAAALHRQPSPKAQMTFECPRRGSSKSRPLDWPKTTTMVNAALDPFRAAPASMAGWPVRCTIPSPHRRVRTSNTPSFPLKGCKKIVMIVTIVTR